MKYNLELNVLKATQMNRMTRGDEAHGRLNPKKRVKEKSKAKDTDETVKIIKPIVIMVILYCAAQTTA